MKKILLITVVFSILCSITLIANGKCEIVKKIYTKGNSYFFCQYDSSITYIAGIGHLVILDGNGKTLQNIGEWLDTNKTRWTFSTIYDAIGRSDNALVVVMRDVSFSSFATNGLLKIDNYKTNPKIINFTPFENDNDINPLVQGMCIVPREDGKGYCYARLAAYHLEFRSLDGDTLLSEYEYPVISFAGAIHYYGLFASRDYRSLLFLSNNSSVGMVRFDMKTKEFENYDSANPAMPIDASYALSSEWTLPQNSRSYISQTNNYGSEHYGDLTTFATKIDVIRVDSVDTTYSQYGYTLIDTIANVYTCLLRYDNGVWDTINVEFPNTPYHNAGDFVPIACNVLDSVHVAFTCRVIRHDTTKIFEGMIMNNNKEFFIYNIVTRECKAVFISDTIVAYDPIVDIQSYTYKGKRGIGMLVENGLFIFYDSTATSISDTDEGIFQEIGIRKVYPNPVSRGSVNADIMCYVRDLSKIEIGLYNLMGQKIMDLSENYEYSDATHTIYTKFDVPIGLNNGVYYLNVRNGTERRTQPVVIMSGY